MKERVPNEVHPEQGDSRRIAGIIAGVVVAAVVAVLLLAVFLFACMKGKRMQAARNAPEDVRSCPWSCCSFSQTQLVF